MNRRLVFSLAGAAVLALILFAALALLNQNRPGTGPTQSDVRTQSAARQVAQAPTSTSAPIALPTPTALPTNTLIPTATTAQGTRAPTATPTETPLPPTATPTPSEPIPLPALARWQETGYGGGGTGGTIPTQRAFVLGTALPEGPAQMTVYLQREPEKLTAAYAAEMAERLGVRGPVYQSLRLATVPDPDDEPFRGYLVVDGAREVTFEHTGIVYYSDRNRTSFFDGHWREPGNMPPLEQALRTAEAFLNAHSDARAGLLDGEIETAASGDMIRFYRVLDGGWPLVEPVAGVNIWTDGQVGQAQYWPLELDVLAEYPIRSAQEAWEILSAGQPDERVWQYPYRGAELPPWGEWRHQNLRFWARSYTAGQQAHRFGVPRAWFPIEAAGATEAGGAPFVAMGDLVLAGDVQPLAEYILDRYIREAPMYVHVWGEVQDVGEVQTLRLEGWDPAEESYWWGTVLRQGDQAALVSDDGRTIQLPDLPADLADGTQVSVSGGQQGDRLEWHVIQEMSFAEPPPGEAATETQLTTEQVDLVYLALPPNVLPPERFVELGYRAVQPVWRFRGHNSDGGTAFEFYVQAVTEAYVESRSP